MPTWARIDSSGICVEFSRTDPTGKYHPDLVWIEIPTELLSYVNRVQLGVSDEVVVPTSLDDLKTVMLADIKTSCDAALAPLDAAYPDREVASWPQQIAEATAYTANAAAEVPLLRTMAAERPSLGDTDEARVAELTRRILANAATWSAVAGPIIGKRQAAEDAIGAATTLAEVLAVTVDFTTAAEEESATEEQVTSGS